MTGLALAGFFISCHFQHQLGPITLRSHITHTMGSTDVSNQTNIRCISNSWSSAHPEQEKRHPVPGIALPEKPRALLCKLWLLPWLKCSYSENLAFKTFTAKIKAFSHYLNIQSLQENKWYQMNPASFFTVQSDESIIFSFHLAERDMLGSILPVVQQAQQGLSSGMQWDLNWDLGFSLQTYLPLQTML